MKRSLMLVSASLLAVFGLAFFNSEADARYRRNHDCCQQSGYSSHRYHSSYYSGHRGRYSNSGYYGGNQYYGTYSCGQTGYVGYQQTGICAPATTACCAPQATCCGGTSTLVTAAVPNNAPALQPSIVDNLDPTPTPGN